MQNPSGVPQSRTGAPDENPSIAVSLLAVARAINKTKHHEALCRHAGVDLDRSGSVLLYKLFSEGDDVRLTTLADRLGIDSPAVTRKVQQLESEGYLQRTPDPHDARAMRLRLTTAGRSAVGRLLAAREEWLHLLLADWSDVDQAEFSRLLHNFAQTIDKKGELHRDH